MEINETVIQILNEISEIDDIQLGDHLQRDLALDSLLMVTLLLEIEEVFGIELKESDMNPFELNTVQDVVDMVNGYTKNEY